MSLAARIYRRPVQDDDREARAVVHWAPGGNSCQCTELRLGGCRRTRAFGDGNSGGRTVGASQSPTTPDPRRGSVGPAKIARTDWPRSRGRECDAVTHSERPPPKIPFWNGRVIAIRRYGIILTSRLKHCSGPIGAFRLGAPAIAISKRRTVRARVATPGTRGSDPADAPGSPECRRPFGRVREAPKYQARELLLQLVPGEGFEPPTFGLQNRCTATVLTRLYDHFNQMEIGNRIPTEAPTSADFA